MNIIKRGAARLAKTAYVRQAVAQQADLSAFKARPSLRLIVGVLFIGLAQLMGLPAVAGFGAAAAWMKEPLILIGAPVSYAISWGIWLLGMWLAGPDNIMYIKTLMRWGVRRGVEKTLGASLEKHLNTETDKKEAKDQTKKS